jgi:hypothetical protein
LTWQNELPVGKLAVELNGIEGMSDGLHRDASPVGKIRTDGVVVVVCVKLGGMEFILDDKSAELKDWCEILPALHSKSQQTVEQIS